MASDPFLRAFTATGGHEGGYVDDPADRGGETFRGIARAFHPDWPGWVEIDRRKAAGEPIPAGILEDETRAFYRSEFWDRFNGDDVAAVCEWVALELYDTGVNCGVSTAEAFLQRALNAMNRGGQDWPDLEVDGDVGPATIKALSRCLARRGHTGLMVALNGLQFMRYLEIVERNPSQERFFVGWLQRVELRLGAGDAPAP